MLSLKMRKQIYLLLLGVILAGCSPKLTSSLITNYRPLPRNAEVLVIEPWHEVSSVNSYAEVKIEEEGEYEIWAKTEAKEVLPLSVSKGGDYYVRSGVSRGFIIGHPKLELVSSEQGRSEYWDDFFGVRINL